MFRISQAETRSKFWIIKALSEVLVVNESLLYVLINKGKGKAIPLQAWTGLRVPGV
jgi:hypothetical protein